MYNAFFGFQKDPFAAAPDPEFFFRSKQHDAALSGLLLSVESRMGLISLLGEEGTGKSVVLECLHKSLGTEVPCAFLRDSRISFGGFLETIASDLDLMVKTPSARQIFLALVRLATQQAQSGGTVVLIVDEAHNLAADVFYEIVHTASLQHENVKAIQTIFAGRPEFQARLATLNSERLKQRAILSRSLCPFTARETEEYIEFRLACAGMPKQTVFPRKVLEQIYERSQGLAPAIHALCDRLLVEAFAATSPVCNREIADRVFKKPRRNLSLLVKDAPIVVAAARIDLSLLAAPPEPGPPPMQTALLRVVVDARLGSLCPRAVSADQTASDFAAIASPTAFPSLRPVFANPELAPAPIRPMEPANCSKAADFRASAAVSQLVLSLPIGELSPRLPNPAATAARPIGAPQFPVGKLIARKRYVKLRPAPACAPSPARSSPELLSSANPPMYPRASLHPASVVPSSYVPLTPIRTAEYAPLGLTAAAAEASPLTFENVPQPPRATLQPASVVPCPAVPVPSIRTAESAAPVCTAADAEAAPLTFENVPQPPKASLHPASVVPSSYVPLTPIRATNHEAPVCNAADAEASPLNFVSVAQAMPPRASLQPASVISWPAVPLAPVRATKDAQPQRSASQFGEMEPVTPAGPAATGLDASLQPIVGRLDALLPLPLIAQPVPAPAVTPIGIYLSAQPSLQPRRPTSGLKPSDPRKPSWLSPTTWIPAIASVKTQWAPAAQAFTPTRIPLGSQRKPFVALVIPILAALTLYSAPSAMRAAADFSRHGWQRAQQAVLNRAAVALDEDFRTGLSDWTNSGGSRPSWTTDPSGFVRPAALALYRPSAGMVDYQVQFIGTIDKKGLSWVARAADFNNYYTIRLAVLRPGPLPAIGVTRYAVIHGIPQKRVVTPLLMRAQADTVYRVRLDIQGDHYALWVQDQPVDSWTEPRLGRGSIGFFSEADAGSRIASVHVRGHYDMLGRLCALLMPASISNYR